MLSLLPLPFLKRASTRLTQSTLAHISGTPDGAITASVDQTELDAAAQFTGDVLTIPNRATSGFFFFGVDEIPGYPDSIILDGNPTNQITRLPIEQPTRLDQGR